MLKVTKYFVMPLLFTLFIACSGSDTQMEDEINAKLMAANPYVRATVNDGLVRLTGTCPDESCKNVSETAAKQIAGENKVISEIVVQEK
jgi:osmotically-inducible protein OsmY